MVRQLACNCGKPMWGVRGSLNGLDRCQHWCMCVHLYVQQLCNSICAWQQTLDQGLDIYECISSANCWRVWEGWGKGRGQRTHKQVPYSILDKSQSLLLRFFSVCLLSKLAYLISSKIGVTAAASQPLLCSDLWQGVDSMSSSKTQDGSMQVLAEREVNRVRNAAQVAAQNLMRLQCLSAPTQSPASGHISEQRPKCSLQPEQH